MLLFYFLTVLAPLVRTNAPEVSALTSSTENELEGQASIAACPGENLFSLRACEAKSNCTKISTNADKVSSELLKKEGWCAPSSDALQVGK